MKRILALTLCLVMLVPLFVSCGSKDEEDKGAIIRTYMTSDIYNFDPIYAYTDDAATKIVGMIYEGLFRLDENGKVKKALCKDYEIIEDEENNIYKMQVTINDTGWSDGREVTVDDVVFAWKRILDPEFSCSAAPMLFDIQNAKNYKNGDCSPDDVGLYPVIQGFSIFTLTVLSTMICLSKILRHPFSFPCVRILLLRQNSGLPT